MTERQAKNTTDRRLLSGLFRYGGYPVGPERTIADVLRGGLSPRRTNQQLTELKLTDAQQSKDPLGTVTVSMYEATAAEKAAPLVHHYAGEASVKALALMADPDKMTKRELRRKERYLGAHPEVPDEGYDKGRAEQLRVIQEKLKQRVNSNVFDRIQEGLELNSVDEAARVFQEQRNHANDAVYGHAKLVYQGDMSTQLRNEVLLRRRPADLLITALSPDTNPVLKYEIRRQALDTAIALHHERALSPAADFKLTQIQNLFDEELYDKNKGATQKVIVYAQYNDGTNALQPGTISFEEPTEQAAAGTHYKAISLPVRILQTGERVLTLTNMKEPGSAIRKGRRLAQKRAENGNSGVIQVESDVQDTHRMKLVIVGNHEQSDTLADNVFDLLTDPENHEFFYNKDAIGRVIYDDEGNPTGIPTGEGNVRYGNSGGVGQSDEVNYTKIELEFNEVTNPIKVVVQSLEDFLRDELSIGTYDAETGKYSGAAHELYEIQREKGLDYFPKEIYTYIPRYEGTETPSPALAAKADELRRRGRIELAA